MSTRSGKFEKYKKSEIFPHKHCPVCNKMVPEEGSEFGEYCSEECQASIKKGKKSKKRQWIIMIGAYVVVFAVMIVIFVVNPPGS
ncbi:MAG: DUF2116 family Zn-ribbon domain-containing protein [Promethearchaeota archaeon]